MWCARFNRHGKSSLRKSIPVVIAATVRIIATNNIKIRRIFLIEGTKMTVRLFDVFQQKPMTNFEFLFLFNLISIYNFSSLLTYNVRIQAPNWYYFLESSIISIDFFDLRFIWYTFVYVFSFDTPNLRVFIFLIFHNENLQKCFYVCICGILENGQYCVPKIKKNLIFQLSVRIFLIWC